MPADPVWGDVKRALDPRRGYDLVAAHYERWRWFKFWRQNEAPLIRKWLKGLEPGPGLDAGSGTGTYVADILEHKHSCIAVDLSAKMLKINKRKRGKIEQTDRVFYVQADISNLPLIDEQFDWALCSRVLSHAPDVSSVLKEFARVLKKGGQCLLSDVHPDHPYTRVAIPAGQRKIAIQTYKHPLEELRSHISALGSFNLMSLCEYRMADLCSAPSRADFEKLYRYDNPAVFYVCRLQKV